MKGIATIISVIILGSLMVLIGITMTLTSISKGQVTTLDSQVKSNLSLLDGCAEESLINLNRNNTLPSIINIPSGSCNLTLNSQIGSSWDFSLSTTGAMSPLSVRIILNRGSTISVSSWIDQ